MKTKIFHQKFINRIKKNDINKKLLDKNIYFVSLKNFEEMTFHVSFCYTSRQLVAIAMLKLNHVEISVKQRSIEYLEK